MPHCATPCGEPNLGPFFSESLAATPAPALWQRHEEEGEWRSLLWRTQPGGGEEEREPLLLEEEQSLPSRGTVIAERPHQAEASAANTKASSQAPTAAKWFGKSSICKMRFRCYFLHPYSNAFKWKRAEFQPLSLAPWVLKGVKFKLGSY